MVKIPKIPSEGAGEEYRDDLAALDVSELEGDDSDDPTITSSTLTEGTSGSSSWKTCSSTNSASSNPSEDDIEDNLDFHSSSHKVKDLADVKSRSNTSSRSSKARNSTVFIGDADCFRWSRDDAGVNGWVHLAKGTVEVFLDDEKRGYLALFTKGDRKGPDVILAQEIKHDIRLRPLRSSDRVVVCDLEYSGTATEFAFQFGTPMKAKIFIQKMEKWKILQKLLLDSLVGDLEGPFKYPIQNIESLDVLLGSEISPSQVSLHKIEILAPIRDPHGVQSKVSVDDIGPWSSPETLLREIVINEKGKNAKLCSKRKSSLTSGSGTSKSSSNSNREGSENGEDSEESSSGDGIVVKVNPKNKKDRSLIDLMRKFNFAHQLEDHENSEEGSGSSLSSIASRAAVATELDGLFSGIESVANEPELLNLLKSSKRDIDHQNTPGFDHQLIPKIKTSEISIKEEEFQNVPFGFKFPDGEIPSNTRVYAWRNTWTDYYGGGSLEWVHLRMLDKLLIKLDDGGIIHELLPSRGLTLVTTSAYKLAIYTALDYSHDSSEAKFALFIPQDDNDGSNLFQTMESSLAFLEKDETISSSFQITEYTPKVQNDVHLVELNGNTDFKGLKLEIGVKAAFEDFQLPVNYNGLVSRLKDGLLKLISNHEETGNSKIEILFGGNQVVGHPVEADTEFWISGTHLGTWISPPVTSGPRYRFLASFPDTLTLNLFSFAMKSIAEAANSSKNTEEP